VTIVYSNNQDEERKKKRGKESNPLQKRKRKNKKMQAHVQTITNETKEGQAYESGINIGPDGDHPDIITIPDIPVDSDVGTIPEEVGAA